MPADEAGGPRQFQRARAAESMENTMLRDSASSLPPAPKQTSQQQAQTPRQVLAHDWRRGSRLTRAPTQPPRARRRRRRIGAVWNPTNLTTDVGAVRVSR